MYKKNTAVTGFVIGSFINPQTWSEATSGTVTARRCIDGTSGSCTNMASYDTTLGAWKINLSAADMNGSVVGLKFSMASCLPITHTLKTVTEIPDANGKMAAKLGAADYAGNTPQSGDAYALANGGMYGIPDAIKITVSEADARLNGIYRYSGQFYSHVGNGEGRVYWNATHGWTVELYDPMYENIEWRNGLIAVLGYYSPVAPYATGSLVVEKYDEVLNHLDGTTPIAAGSLVNVPSPTEALAAIKAKTDLITSGANITIVNPVAGDGATLTLVTGDDYFHIHNRSIDFVSDDYPDLTGAVCTLRILSRDTNTVVFTVVGTIVDARTLRYEIPRAQTALLSPAAIGTYIFSSRVTFSDGQIATEKRGQVLVLNG